MPEKGGHEPPQLPEPGDLIQGISRELGLNPQAKPEWGYGPPYEVMFPEEAPTLSGRKGARHCLGRLYYYLEWQLRVDEGKDKSEIEKPSVGPNDLLTAYRHVRDETDIDSDFNDYDLSHVLGAAKRTIAWFEELNRYEETEHYDAFLYVYRAIRDLTEQAVRPDELHLVKDIEEQIRSYIRQAYPAQQMHPTGETYQIFLTAPYLEKHFRSYLNHTPVRLLQEEAETAIARDGASSCHEFLFDRIVGARAAQIPLFPEEIKEHYKWFQKSERHSTEEWQRAGTDFTLENVLGATKRRLLYWHGIKDHQGDFYQTYRDTLAVHNLLNQAVNPNTPQAKQNEYMEEEYQDPHDQHGLETPGDLPF